MKAMDIAMQIESEMPEKSTVRPPNFRTIDDDLPDHQGFSAFEALLQADYPSLIMETKDTFSITEGIQ